MEPHLKNVAINAAPLNPGAITEPMLVRIGVASEEQITTRIFTPAFVQVGTTAFELLVMPDRLQFSPTTEGDEADGINGPLQSIVRALPHTPYTAIGLNFHYLSGAVKQPGSVSRHIFLPESSVFGDSFCDNNCRFGGYFSRDAFGARLRLNVKPRGRLDMQGDTRFHLDFNFHLELVSGSSVDKICEMLGHWGEAFQLTREIAERFGGAL